MQIGVLASPTSWYLADLRRAAQLRGHVCRGIDYAQMTALLGGRTADSHIQSRAIRTPGDADDSPVDLVALDALIVRTMPPGSLEQVVFRMDVLNRLEAAGVTVLNGPRAIECAVDKYLTTARLQAVGLPIPDTAVCEDSDEALSAFEQLGGDVVVKPVFGAEGRGILRVSDRDLAFRTFRTLQRIGAILYLQRFIPHAGYDVRVLVLDGAVVGGIKRFAAAGEYRTNVARNARAEAHDPTAAEIAWSLAAVDAVGARIAGVDILYGAAGEGYVVEVNAVPGWQAFSRTTGIDVAGLVIAAV